MMKNILTAFLFVSIAMGCGVKQYTLKKGAKIQQGVAGFVYELVGNQMPSPDRPGNPDGSPIQTIVYVYELTNQKEQTQEAGIYTNITTRKIAAIKTATNGEFKIALPEGNYSLFVKVEEGLFANLFDDKMNIHPITISKDQITTTKVKVDYKAAY
jgi:hypothetical protein